MAIEGTLLYNALRERWAGRDDWPELIRQLNIADEGMLRGHMDKQATDIGTAFTWIHSPQGSAFWSERNNVDYDLRRGRVPRMRTPTVVIKPKEKEYAAIYR